MKSILIVEDDKNLNKGLMLALKDNYRTFTADSIQGALEHVSKSDLIILDMNLPDGDGLDLIEQVRKHNDQPIIVLSARNMEMDIVTAIQMGADDYITKPFSLGILLAKIERILERIDLKRNNQFTFGEMKFDFNRGEYTVKTERVHLTITEEKILYYLIQARGDIVTREMLLDKIWSTNESFIDENTLSVNVNRLRKKLEPENPIETVYGVGYKWKY
ncbi:DNA-binding response regulator, OmpR family, contains REC and winged-helix (wHTH) domain [Peptoniphilus asaccharolyticus DSM 20463]|uniref:DNA-binding response regulator, OmpR family, contains REC and winged-helix (WHTH) domain n=1 Tax=Peptoniphilus asaccharolyticus DSM 20463 TaxID=573058 RepID=A0A1W1VBU5_PEPAS|nr:response regulator transcription factor [Peptoniphilus asaccharolyticus]MBL7575624.1 response regulator transcription factor [Peptoniphilus asaccharolyticus]SMB90937.1 DNA-binding response regulator, OmpR family, contains REC and winged-helix (wHTH) domain [Peptoniphilus asaccharolyticus DSM 20463]